MSVRSTDLGIVLGVTGRGAVPAGGRIGGLRRADAVAALKRRQGPDGSDYESRQGLLACDAGGGVVAARQEGTQPRGDLRMN